MQYKRNADGSFAELAKKNVDFGGGLERIAAAAIDSPDVFKISLFAPIIAKLQELSGKDYDSNTAAMRVIADHLRAAAFLAVDDVVPSNKEQGYVMRRLIRRAVRFAFDLGIEQNFLEEIVPVIADLYADDYPEVRENRAKIVAVLAKEEKAFRQTLRKAVKQFAKIFSSDNVANDGEKLFVLYDTYGFPVELSVEEAFNRGINLSENWREQFEAKMAEQRAKSRRAMVSIKNEK
jgi:alanyl-tRNA synthetase